MIILFDPLNPTEATFAEENSSLENEIDAFPYDDSFRKKYPGVSALPAVVNDDGKIYSGVTSLDDIPRIPKADRFYNDLASSPEYGAILTYGATNPATPIPLLLGVAIATAAEAKSYQQSGGKNVNFDRVQASLDQLIAALPDEIDDFNKADIVTKINTIATDNSVPLTLS